MQGSSNEPDLDPFLTIGSQAKYISPDDVNLPTSYN